MIPSLTLSVLSLRKLEPAEEAEGEEEWQDEEEEEEEDWREEKAVIRNQRCS